MTRFQGSKLVARPHPRSAALARINAQAPRAPLVRRAQHPRRPANADAERARLHHHGHERPLGGIHRRARHQRGRRPVRRPQLRSRPRAAVEVVRQMPSAWLFAWTLLSRRPCIRRRSVSAASGCRSALSVVAGHHLFGRSTRRGLGSTCGASNARHCRSSLAMSIRNRCALGIQERAGARCRLRNLAEEEHQCCTFSKFDLRTNVKRSSGKRRRAKRPLACWKGLDASPTGAPGSGIRRLGELRPGNQESQNRCRSSEQQDLRGGAGLREVILCVRASRGQGAIRVA